jgi:phage terminase small subunit
VLLDHQQFLARNLVSGSRLITSVAMSRTTPPKAYEPLVADDATRAVIQRGTPDGKLGPAMLALNERQRLFVTYMVETGSANATRAAAFAGYSAENHNALRVTAHRLAHDEKVLAALHEEASRRMRASAILAVSELTRIAGDPTHKDQVRAIAMVLDRSGLHATSEHKMTVEHTDLDNQAMVKGIVEMCRQIGLDPRAMLGKVDGLVIDAEYQIVAPPARQIEPVRNSGSTAGLEDLL